MFVKLRDICCSFDMAFHIKLGFWLHVSLVEMHFNVLVVSNAHYDLDRSRPKKVFVAFDRVFHVLLFLNHDLGHVIPGIFGSLVPYHSICNMLFTIWPSPKGLYFAANDLRYNLWAANMRCPATKLEDFY